MLINCDVKGLEVVGCAELSGDEVLKQEIRSGVDIHEANRDRFHLGEGKVGRLVAKIFKFRLIYGGSAWSYAHDPDFTGVSTSEKFWQGVIDEYYQKYRGIWSWHKNIVQIVRERGYLDIPSGRHYYFYQENSSRGPQWPITKIKNYPVQGFGADLVMLARIEFNRQLIASGLEGDFIQTVHDSLVADVPSRNVVPVAQIMQAAIRNIPNLCRSEWGYDFSLPLDCELQVGMNKKEMTPLTLH